MPYKEQQSSSLLHESKLQFTVEQCKEIAGRAYIFQEIDTLKRKVPAALKTLAESPEPGIANEAIPLSRLKIRLQELEIEPEYIDKAVKEFQNEGQEVKELCEKFNIARPFLNPAHFRNYRNRKRNNFIKKMKSLEAALRNYNPLEQYHTRITEKSTLGRRLEEILTIGCFLYIFKGKFRARAVFYAGKEKIAKIKWYDFEPTLSGFEYTFFDGSDFNNTQIEVYNPEFLKACKSVLAGIKAKYKRDFELPGGE